ncbi:unnamed protein product [Pylaiella littoralis]
MEAESKPGGVDDSCISPALVYHLTKDASVQTRHLVVYNTGPAVGVDEVTLWRVFGAYGEVERVYCPNPAAARVLITFREASSAARAKAERNRPPEVEERVRVGVPGAAAASDVFAPVPGEPCPLLGRWLKVAFADVRVRHNGGSSKGTTTNGVGGGRKKEGDEGGSSLPPPPALPAHLKNFKAFDALAAGGTASRDSRPTPCPLCGRSCGGQRGLRMHLVGAHPLEIRDRHHFVRLLQQGSASLPPMSQLPPPPPPSPNGNNTTNGVVPGDGVQPSSAVSSGRGKKFGKGAAAKGRAAAALLPGFAAARAGDLEALKKLVEGRGGGSGKWDPKAATDKNGSSPLDWAAGEGRLEVCRYLLNECGVDPGGACTTRGRGEGRTSLHWAARGGHEEVCRLLLETPRPLSVDGSSAAAAATAAAAASFGGGGTPGVDVADFVCPDVAAAEGTTPLHWACWGAHLSTCQLLFERGANHRSVNAYGCNVAHWCGLSGDVNVCRWLSRSVEEGGAGGLDWAKTNLQGHTICHKAALKGHRGLLEWLAERTDAGVVSRCAWARDEGGYTPQDVAALAGHVDLADWIAESGVQPLPPSETSC